MSWMRVRRLFRRKGLRSSRKGLCVGFLWGLIKHVGRRLAYPAANIGSVARSKSVGMVDFKDTHMEYVWTVHELSKTMFRKTALSLDLDEKYYDDFASDPDGKYSNLGR